MPDAEPEGRLFTGQEISEFLLRACHDLRTPLRAIRAHAQLLAKAQDLSVSSGGDPRLAFIIDGAARMDQLVDGLAGYSIALRIDPGSFVLNRSGFYSEAPWPSWKRISAKIGLR